MENHENAEIPVNSEREHIIQKLDEIDGIGKVTAEALYAIGIHSYTALAEYLRQHADKEILEALKKQGRSGSIDRERWIRSLSNKQEHTPPSLSVEEREPGKKTEGTRSGQQTQDHDTEFTVFFDVKTDKDGKPILHTTVYDPKDAGEEKVFEGNVLHPWVDWMLGRANLPFEVDIIAPQAEVADETQNFQVEAAIPFTAVKPIDARIEISNIQISMVEPSAEISEKRLKAEINFRLSGSDAETLASQAIPLWTEFYTIDLDKGIQECVASKESRLEPDQFEYSYPMEFAFPIVGRYGTLSFVRLRPFGDLSAFLWGATMRIIP